MHLLKILHLMQRLLRILRVKWLHGVAGYYPGRRVFIHHGRWGRIVCMCRAWGLNLGGRLWGMLGLGDLTISITGSGGQTLWTSLAVRNFLRLLGVALRVSRTLR